MSLPFAEIGQILQISARKRLEHPVRRPCEIDCQGDPGGARIIGHQGIEAALGMENELVRCAQVDLQVLEPNALRVAHQPAGGIDRAELAGLFVDQRQKGCALGHRRTQGKLGRQLQNVIGGEHADQPLTLDRQAPERARADLQRRDLELPVGQRQPGLALHRPKRRRIEAQQVAKGRRVGDGERRTQIEAFQLDPVAWHG